MSIINKFIQGNINDPHILVCSSKTQMIYVKDIMDNSDIANDLIPTPKGLGGVCTTAIKFDKRDLDKVNRIINDNKIEYEGIHSLKKKYRYDLKSLLNQEISQMFKEIIRKVENNINLDKRDIEYLLKIDDQKEYDTLIEMADIIRRECVGDRIELRAAIEFSNYCSKNCKYCGVRRENSVPRYRMTEDEIMGEVDKLYKIGIKTVILQSGEDPYYTTERILLIIKSIKDRYRMGITLSLGERDEHEYRLFSETGVDNYLLKIETFSEKLFKEIHPDDDYNTRVKHHKLIKDSGIRLGSGGMIGLPNQTIEEIAEDIIFQRDFGVHMIGFGPFIPAKGTPFEDSSPGSLSLTLKVVAVTRIVCQHVFLPATTAIASLNPDGQTMALKAGANTIMLISTPVNLRKNYEIYSNKNMVDLSFAIKSTRDSGRKLPKYLNYDFISKLGYDIEEDLIK